LFRPFDLTWTLELCLVPFQVAVTGTDVVFGTAVALATKVAVVRPAGIVTVNGTASPLPEARDTVAAVTDRGLVMLTVHKVLVNSATALGEQFSDPRPTAGDTERLVDLVTPLKVAEMVPDENTETDSAVPVKVAEEVPP